MVRRAAAALGRMARARPGLVLAALAAPTLVLGAAAPFTRWDASPDLLAVSGSEALATYRDYLERFGSDELLVIALQRPDLLAPEGLRMVRGLTEALRDVPGVAQVQSLDTLVDVDVGPFGPFARPVVPDDLDEAPAPAALREAVAALPMAEGLLDASGTTTAIVVKPEGRALGAAARDRQRRMLEGVEAVLADAALPGTRVHLAGSPVFNRELARMNGRDAAVFTPVAVALVVVLLAVSLRDLRMVALAMAAVLGTLASVRGVMTLADVPLNTTTSLLAPLLLVLGVSVSVHVLARYQRERAAGLPRGAAVDATEKGVRAPAALTALTTACGFASLAASRIPSVRSFGLLAALGAVAAFALGGVALPAALRLVGPPARLRRRDARLLEALPRLARAASAHAPAVIAGAAVLAAVAAAGLPRLRISTHDGDFFGPDHPLNRAYDVIESRLGGVTPLELVLHAEDGAGDLRRPEAIALLERLQGWLAERPETTRGVSVADWIARARRALEGPEAAEARPLDADGLDRALFVAGAVAGEDLPYYVQDDWRTLRLSARSHALDSEENVALLHDVERAAARFAADVPGVTVDVTGLVPVFARMEETLLDSQIRSFALALASVFVLLLALFRSLPLAALAMLPNLLAVLLAAGVMAWGAIPLDVVTVMVASVNLGIVVDDTIHVTHAWRAARAEGLDGDAALALALRRTGRAVVFTSVVLALGFAVLMLSDFRPTARFGGLTALTVVVALAADLVLLPALLGVAGRAAWRTGGPAPVLEELR